jgi:tetratricopeptide (TPR) repeat protein
MRTPKPRLALLTPLGALGLLALLAIQPPLRASAADEAPRAAIDLEELRRDREQKALRYPVAQRISRYLSAAAKEVDAGDPAEATRLLKKLRPDRLNPYERALVYRMLAFVAYGANQSEQAIEYFEKFLEEEVLPIRDEARVRFNIAQLYASLQQWHEAIDWLNRWLLYVEDPDPLGFYLMGIAYYQLEDFDAAIAQTKRAVEARPEPREAWLRLLAALHAQKQDYENAAPVLEELVLRYPKKDYWVQLSLIYGAHEDYRRSLSVQQVAYAQGFLTEDKELRRLARSYLFHELPYPAARGQRGVRTPREQLDRRARVRTSPRPAAACREVVGGREPVRAPGAGAHATRSLERGVGAAGKGHREGRPEEPRQRGAAARHRLLQRRPGRAGAFFVFARAPARLDAKRGESLDHPPRHRGQRHGQLTRRAFLQVRALLWLRAFPQFRGFIELGGGRQPRAVYQSRMRLLDDLREVRRERSFRLRLRMRAWRAFRRASSRFGSSASEQQRSRYSQKSS